MNEKQLIVPVVVSGIDTADCLIGTATWFFRDMKGLVSYIEWSASSILVGTTSESHHMNAKQRRAVYHALKQHASPDSPGQDIPIIAGILGSDETIEEQIWTAKEFGIKKFALGLNHTGNNDTRVDTTLATMQESDELMLYHMPGGFPPASIEDTMRWSSMDKRIIWIKDSSNDKTYYAALLDAFLGRENFSVFCGSEAIWRELSTQQRDKSAGLVSGTANVSPKLLHQFMVDPKSVADQYDDLVAELGKIEPPFDAKVRVGGIQSYIARMKKKLMRLWVFSSPSSDNMYSKPGEAFL